MDYDPSTIRDLSSTVSVVLGIVGIVASFTGLPRLYPIVAVYRRKVREMPENDAANVDAALTMPMFKTTINPHPKYV
jgi:hypothetical protein